MINADMIFPIVFVTILLGLILVTVVYNVADFSVYLYELWENERLRAEKRKSERANRAPAPFLAITYVKHSDDGDDDSSEPSVEPRSTALEPPTEPPKTIDGSSVLTREQAITLLASIRIENGDDTPRQLSQEMIAKIVGISKQSVGPLVRTARNIPEPDKKPEPYTFVETEPNKFKRIDK